MTAGARVPSGTSLTASIASRALGLLPALLVLVAEGAWVFVVYALFQSASHDPTTLGPLAFAVAAGLGAGTGRMGPRRLGPAWPAVAVALVAIAATLGWLTSDGSRVALTTGDVGAALVTHPGGWLVGLALLRGIGESRGHRDDAPPGALIAIAIPAIVGSFLIAGALPAAASATFRADAVPATVLFVGADLVGLALARIGRLDTASGFDWRRNPAWFVLLLVVAGVLLVLAVPAAFAIGPLVVLALAALPIPLLILGLLSGFDRRALRTLLSTIGTVAVAILVIRLFASGPGQQGQQPPPAGIPPAPTSEQAWTTIAAWIVLVVTIAVVVAILAAVWMRSSRAPEDEDVAEERSIDRGSELVPRPGWHAPWRRRPRRPDPMDAIGAYLAAVATLKRDPGLARHEDETPAEHARRVRRSEIASIPDPLERLAADYELAVFGGRTLTGPEERRAIVRWLAIRDAVGGRGRPRPTPRGPAP